MASRHLAATALSLLCVGSGFAADTPSPQSNIKMEQPEPGSRIRRDMVMTVNMPLNLSYGQLWPEHRASLHRSWESIAPGDEPPYPVDGMRAIVGPLGKAQQKLLVDGDLFVVAKVDAAGVVQEVETYASPSQEMGQVAARVLFSTTFKPAVCGGRPCAMEFPLRVLYVTR